MRLWVEMDHYPLIDAAHGVEEVMGRPMIPHSHSGSAFVAEPREWFGNKRHRLLFTHKDPSLVLHLKSRTCRELYPHKTKDCGYFAAAAGRKR